MSGTRVTGWVAGAAMFLGLVAVPAQAQAAGAPVDNGAVHPPSSQVAQGPGVAEFEGHSINLATDWGSAQACLVWRQGGVVECFRSAHAMEQRERLLDPQRSASAAPTTAPASTASTASLSYSCSSSLRLFDYGGYGGRELDFWDRGYWQNLGDFGFDNRTSSYIVGGCYAHLAEYGDGAGWWYPGATSPYHGEPWMYSGWSDRVSSIYIE